MLLSTIRGSNTLMGIIFVGTRLIFSSMIIFLVVIFIAHFTNFVDYNRRKILTDDLFQPYNENSSLGMNFTSLGFYISEAISIKVIKIRVCAFIFYNTLRIFNESFQQLNFSIFPMAKMARTANSFTFLLL